MTLICNYNIIILFLSYLSGFITWYSILRYSCCFLISFFQILSLPYINTYNLIFTQKKSNLYNIIVYFQYNSENFRLVLELSGWPPFSFLLPQVLSVFRCSVVLNLDSRIIQDYSIFIIPPFALDPTDSHPYKHHHQSMFYFWILQCSHYLDWCVFDDVLFWFWSCGFVDSEAIQ